MCPLCIWLLRTANNNYLNIYQYRKVRTGLLLDIQTCGNDTHSHISDAGMEDDVFDAKQKRESLSNVAPQVG